jgi:alkylhydroperoxidase family enzyme
MPYRFHIPDGVAPLEQLLNHTGTPALVRLRQTAHHVVYSAPETNLSPREREVMRMPFTAMMGCPICNSARLWRDFPGFSDRPIEEQVYKNAEVMNIDWPGFTTREQLLLGFVKRFSDQIDELNGDDEFWAQLQSHFTEQEIGDVVIMCGSWLGIGRGLKALGIGSQCEIATEETMRMLREPRAAAPG